MIRICSNKLGILLIALVSLLLPAWPAFAQAQQSDQNKAPAYTMPEYNAFQAAQSEKDSQGRIKYLDDFVSKYPNSTLLQYVYNLYSSTYVQLKNYPKAIEYADKLAGLGDAVDTRTRLSAIQTHVQLFPYAYSGKPTTDQLAKQRDAAVNGIKVLQGLQKPADSNLTDAQFADQKKAGVAFFYTNAGSANLQLKDYPAAAEAYKAALANKPDDAVSSYNLGRSYLQMTPPKTMDGLWAVARALNLKVPDADKIKDFLLKQIIAYEQPNCDSLATAQLNELLQLAGTSGDRPETYSIPAAADLQKIAQSSTIVTLISDLKASGDKAKMTWLALCGLEFPEVVGKVIDVKPATDSVQLLLYTGATPEDIQAATTANLDVKVVGQPETSRIQKDDGVRFSGTLSTFDPDPAFMLHWDKAKINPEDIPAEKGGTKHAPHKLPPKKSGK